MIDRFVALATASNAAAMLALIVPWVIGPYIELGTLIDLLFLLPLGWFLLTISGLIVDGKRGRWLLLGGPVALFNLVWFVATFSPCDQTGHGCL